MRKAEIDVGGVYVAEVEYAVTGKVEIIEKGVERPHGYGAGDTRKDGVRVRLLAEARRALFNDERVHPVGKEYLIASRDVKRAWTKADDALAAQKAVVRTRAEGIKARFENLGFDTARRRSLRFGDGAVSMNFEDVERLLDLAEGGGDA